MGVLWHQIHRSSTSSSQDNSVAGAVPCVVGSRLYLVGGSAAATDRRRDPNIFLDVYECTWSDPADTPPTEETGKECGGGPDNINVAAEAADQTATAPVLAASTTLNRASGSLVEITAVDGVTQEGEVPPARIGHAAVVDSSRSAIFVFGGEVASISATASLPLFAKLSDVYEGVPKDSNLGRLTGTTLAWRALAEPASSTSVSTVGDPTAASNGKTSIAVAEAQAPAPMAFHAACTASMNDEWVMIVHGGIDQTSRLLGDLWAFHRRRLGDQRADSSSGYRGEFFWERLVPNGQGPPPMAYHSATTMNNGQIIAFIGGNETESGTLGVSTVFLLDMSGLAWASLPVDGLSGRHMHSAISVLTINEEPSPMGDQQKGRVELPKTMGTDAPMRDASSAEARKLWNPKSTGTFKASAVGGLGGAEGTNAEHEGNVKSQDSAPPVVFESILIFGGVADGKVVGDAAIMRADGTLDKLPLDQRTPSSTPECRYNHAMASVRDGRQALLLGGCRGDGTRPCDAFVLDLASSTGADDGEKGNGKGGDKDKQNIVTFDNGDVYSGQLDADGRRHGQGRCDYANSGGSYAGEWEADKPHGCGERIYPPAGGWGVCQGQEGGEEEEDFTIDAFGPGCPIRLASYKGDWKQGVREGNGVCVFAVEISTATTTPSGDFHGEGGGASTTVPDSYEGEWMGGRPFGRGILRMRPATTRGSSGPTTSTAARNGRAGRGCGSSISGKWTEEGLAYGREVLPGKGGAYEGQYRRGKREGRGRLELPDGSEFEGTWKNGRQNGFGTFRCGVTRQLYTGKWVGGVRCGKGTCEYPSGSRYEGLWLDNKRHGEGVLVSPTGESLRGVWHRDELIPPVPTSSPVMTTEN